MAEPIRTTYTGQIEPLEKGTSIDFSEPLAKGAMECVEVYGNTEIVTTIHPADREISLLPPSAVWLSRGAVGNQASAEFLADAA